MGQRSGHGIGRSSHVCAVEMSYLRGACGVSRWDERCGIRGCGSEVWGGL